MRNLSVGIPASDLVRGGRVSSGECWGASISTSGPGRRPNLAQRPSKDDIDLHFDSLHNLASGYGRLAGPRRKTVTLPALSAIGNGDEQLAIESNKLGDAKGKQRSADEDAAIPGHADGMPLKGLSSAQTDDRDSEVVFGWMSPSNPGLVRNKSKSSIKSESSRRSSNSLLATKRFFRKTGGILPDEEEEDEDRPSRNSTLERSLEDLPPLSPLSHHVSFQLDTELSSVPPFSPTLGLTGNLLGRKRSASRSSAISIASGSSTSTIRQLQHKQNEKEERILRLRRHDNIQNYLVRSRITLSLLASRSTSEPISARMHTMPRSQTLPLPSTFDNLEKPPVVSDSSAKPNLPSKPFLVSSIHPKSMEPSFSIDPSDLLVPPDARDTLLREERVLVGVWVERLVRRETGNTDTEQREWKLLFEWDVDFRALRSLGSNVGLLF